MLTPKQFYSYVISKKSIERLKEEHAHYKKREDDWLGKSTAFIAGNKTLVFIGASHIRGEHPFIKFLVNAFEKADPQFVLVESPRSTRSEELSLSMKNRPKGIWTEIQWCTYLATEKRIRIAGMDVERGAFFEPSIKLKDRLKVGILTWIIRYYDQNKRGFEGDAIKHPEDRYLLAKASLIRDFVFPHGSFEHFRKDFLSLREREYKGLSLNGMIDAVVGEMTRKYIAKRPFLELFEKESALDAPYGPWTDSTKYKINKISAYLTSNRDVCMMKECIARLKEFDRVFAVAGSGHIDVEREVLAMEIAKEFGACKVMRWEEYVKGSV